MTRKGKHKARPIADATQPVDDVLRDWAPAALDDTVPTMLNALGSQDSPREFFLSRNILAAARTSASSAERAGTLVGAKPPSGGTVTGSGETTVLPRSSGSPIASSEGEGREEEERHAKLGSMSWAYLCYTLLAGTRSALPPLFAPFILFIIVVLGYIFVQDNASHLLDSATGLLIFLAKTFFVVSVVTLLYAIPIIWFDRNLDRQQRRKRLIIFVATTVSFGLAGLLLLFIVNRGTTGLPAPARAPAAGKGP